MNTKKGPESYEDVDNHLGLENHNSVFEKLTGGKSMERI